VHVLDEGIIYGSIVQTLELCQAKGYENSFALLAECDPNVASYESARKILDALTLIFEIEFNSDDFEDVIAVLKERIRESTRYMQEDTFDKTRESHL